MSERVLKEVDIAEHAEKQKGTGERAHYKLAK